VQVQIKPANAGRQWWTKNSRISSAIALSRAANAGIEAIAPEVLQKWRGTNHVPVETALLAALDAAGIGWSLHEHEAVFTVEASARLHAVIAGQHTKNLFLKDAGGQFWIVSAPHDAAIDLKALPAAIGAKKVSFGKAEDMERLLGISPGSVTPLAAFNDREGAVKVVIDRRLAEAGTVNVHPLRNTATLGLSGADLVTFLTGIGHAPVVALLPAPS
jgi:Ala-tRNA(Pro) deacylase